MGARRGRAGSILLLVAASVVLLRPWESGALPWTAAGAEGPGRAVVRVIRVVDGDTIEVRFGGGVEDVRLIGVDTPETVDPEAPVQCFGPRASRFQHHLVEGRRLRLVFGVERRDAYGRLLAYAYIGHRSINAELLRRGLARTLTIAPNDRYAARFARLELAAARAGRGLWGACPP
jgi:micrococcal nuclease